MWAVGVGEVVGEGCEAGEEGLLCGGEACEGADVCVALFVGVAGVLVGVEDAGGHPVNVLDAGDEGGDDVGTLVGLDLGEGGGETWVELARRASTFWLAAASSLSTSVFCLRKRACSAASSFVPGHSMS